MADSKHTCESCTKQIRAKTSCIGCCQCKKWYHKKCSKLSNTEFNIYYAEYRKKGSTSWKCNDCVFEVSIIVGENESDAELDDDDEPTLSTLSTSRSEIEKIFEKYLSPFKEKIEKIEKNVTGIRADLNKFAEQNKNLTHQQKIFDKRITDIENKLTTINKYPDDPNSVIAEINERKKRESQVIILNIPESKKPVGVDRRQDDIDSVTAIIPEELSDIVPDIKLRRLGKPAQDKTRPVLLYAPTVAAARTILRSRPANNPDIRFKPSLTQAQQLHLRTLRTELDDLTQGGDNKKTIKYVNGVPKIVDKQNFRPSRSKNKEI